MKIEFLKLNKNTYKIFKYTIIFVILLTSSDKNVQKIDFFYQHYRIRISKNLHISKLNFNEKTLLRLECRYNWLIYQKTMAKWQATRKRQNFLLVSTIKVIVLATC